MTDYTALITSEHQNKPKFAAMVEAVSGCFTGVNAFLYSLIDAFDLDLAEGVQLDDVGEWVGLGRHVSTPLPNVYFSLDVAGLGLDEGYLKGPYDPDNGVSTLDDETYRVALRVKIAANHWDGTTDGLNDLFGVRVGGGTVAFVEDHQDMSMSYCLWGEPPAQVVLSLFKSPGLVVKPAGVKIDGYYKTSLSGYPFLGLDATGDYVAGLDEGALAVEF